MGVHTLTDLPANGLSPEGTDTHLVMVEYHSTGTRLTLTTGSDDAAFIETISHSISGPVGVDATMFHFFRVGWPTDWDNAADPDALACRP
ncbi:hypothetical protein [Arthrobacter sp. A5]|uniref:hypothetical protein n=1 Tax=Arthrobacter sp. A5 TaxID=576926 RepID=UPI003DA9049E